MIIRRPADRVAAVELIANREALVACLQRDLEYWRQHMTDGEAIKAAEDIGRRVESIMAIVQSYRDAVAIYDATNTCLPEPLRNIT